MANPEDPFAPGGKPFVGRVHEVSAAQELEYALPQTATATNEAHRAKPERHEEARALPFIGEVVSYLPGASIITERRLTLKEDLHLADHHFVHAAGIKPLAACFPVVPMTVSLEVMAEAAACLAPGYGLIGFESVTAARWIALVDTDEITLRVEAKLEQFDPLHDTYRIGVAVFVKGEPAPSTRARLLFSKHYQLGLSFGFDELVVRSTLDASQIYSQRHLFHGPRFQCLAGSIALGEQGAEAELLVRSPEDMFRSTRCPQLLTDPALLDTVGQLIGIWSMQQERITFPIGVGKIELYGPTPAPGTRVRMRVEISGSHLKMLNADVEIADGAGDVWLRIKDWKSWQFKWDRRLIDFRRMPTRYLLSDTLAVTLAPCGSLPGPVCQRLTTERLAGFEPALLARHYLHMEEMAAFSGKSATPPRQLQWLLGRIAAKDAVRAWSARQRGAEETLHPAAFAIEYDARGQPRVAKWPDGGLPIPAVSIAHCENQAIALAHGDAAGVDLERIAGRGADFLKAISSEEERGLLAAFSGAGLDEWVTRLWCAKEALGKQMGTGVNEAPQRFEARAIGADHSLRMRHRGSGAQSLVTTMRDGDFIIAFGIGTPGAAVAASDNPDPVRTD
jgi:phosphopantetheinyl transferase